MYLYLFCILAIFTNESKCGLTFQLKKKEKKERKIDPRVISCIFRKKKKNPINDLDPLETFIHPPYRNFRRIHQKYEDYDRRCGITDRFEHLANYFWNKREHETNLDTNFS